MHLPAPHNAGSHAMALYAGLTAALEPSALYLMLNAVANQLRFPNRWGTVVGLVSGFRVDVWAGFCVLGGGLGGFWAWGSGGLGQS